MTTSPEFNYLSWQDTFRLCEDRKGIDQVLLHALQWDGARAHVTRSFHGSETYQIYPHFSEGSCSEPQCHKKPLLTEAQHSHFASEQAVRERSCLSMCNCRQNGEPHFRIGIKGDKNKNSKNISKPTQVNPDDSTLPPHAAATAAAGTAQGRSHADRNMVGRHWLTQHVQIRISQNWGPLGNFGIHSH